MQRRSPRFSRQASGAINGVRAIGRSALRFEEPLKLTVVRDEVGEYHAEVVVDMAGQWRFRWVSEDPDRVAEGSFVVRRSEYTNYDPPPVPSGLTWGQLVTLPWGAFRNLRWGDITP